MWTLFVKVLIENLISIASAFSLQIHVHSSLESLNEYVPKDMLPEEYGGKAGPIAEINRKFKTEISS